MADAPATRERIAKVIARAGLCSRRDAERWIALGRVALNGQTLASPAVTVTAGDRIAIDGKPLPAAEAAKLWRYHKPRGLVTTHRDPEGRPTVFAALQPRLGHAISVGRLDINSEGLLLLTNDGALARHLELPGTGWVRRYRARVHGRVDQATLDGLMRGVTVDGVRYGPIEAMIDSNQAGGRRSEGRSNIWITLALREGKNREIRRVIEHLGWQVTRLIRISYGPFQLGDLAPGDLRDVPGKVMKEQLGAWREAATAAEKRIEKRGENRGNKRSHARRRG